MTMSPFPSYTHIDSFNFEKILCNSHLKSREFVDTNLIEIGIHSLNKRIGMVQHDSTPSSRQGLPLATVLYSNMRNLGPFSPFPYKIAHSSVPTERYM